MSPSRSNCSTCSRELNNEYGHTLVAVLHDLNQACRYADEIIAMKDGAIVAQGSPEQIITAELVDGISESGAPSSMTR